MPAPSLLGDVKNNAPGSPLRHLKSRLPLGGRTVRSLIGTIDRVGYRPWRRARSVLLVICLAAIPAALFAQVQEASRRPLIEYVTASPPCEPRSGTISLSLDHKPGATNDDIAVPNVQSPRKLSTSGERWEKFEVEFGIPHKDSSLFKGSMEAAKYRLDRTLFGVQEFVQDFQNAVAFDYQLRSFGRSSSSTNRLAASSVPIPLWDTMENARLQSDIDLNMRAGRAFVGVQLVLPIGK